MTRPTTAGMANLLDAVLAATSANERAAPLLRRVLNAEPPSTALTHYTDQAGALGLLSTRELWATHPQYLNDEEEMEYARRVWQTAYLRLRAEWDAPERHASSDTIQALDLLFRRIFEDADSEPLIPVNQQVYVACFTTETDQLSQWRGYGGTSGPPYSLSFDAKSLPNFRPLRTRPDQAGADEVDIDCTVRLVKVGYIPQNRAYRPIMDALDKFLTNFVPSVLVMTKKAAEREFEDAAAYIRQMMGLTAAGLKNHGFREEGEWRLVITQDEKADPPLFRPTSMGLAPYKRLVNATLVGDEAVSTYVPAPLDVVGVTQGPHPAGKLGLEAMNRVLDAYGYGIAFDPRLVKQSSISLRR